MIITKQQLQQLIDEEFSRAVERRRLKALNESTAHEVGAKVRSTVDTQGLKKGQEYTVVDTEHGPFGTVMYGVQPVTGGKQLWIANGHLLLQPVEQADEDDDEDDGSWAYAAKVNRIR